MPRYWLNFKYVQCLWDDIKKGRKDAMLYQPLFLTRRSLILFAAFVLNKMGGLQSLTFLLGCSMMLTYLIAVMPFEDRKQNMVEIGNEVVVLLLAYYYLFLTAVDLDVKQMRNMGIVINLTIAIIFFGNFIISM